MRLINICISLSLTLLCLTLSAETVRILGIGNSFTYNSTRYLPGIIQSNPRLSAEVGLVDIGGSSMQQHATWAKEHEMDPSQGSSYRYAINGETLTRTASLRDVLLDKDWDYITIQQVSTQSYKIETYYPYAEELIHYIQKYAPEAEIHLHETWAHNPDSHRNIKWGLDPDETYEKIHAAYHQIAREFGLKTVPVGTAFQNAKQDPLWDYQPTTIDVSKLTYPEDKDNLPDESKSLHKIFQWKKNKEGEMEVRNDGFHARDHGQYLGALVWYESFLGADARTVTYIPEGVTTEQAKSLQEIAHATVQANQSVERK
ncbi:DUF4886 domain-containing protein [Coraliomargarita sp. SDUM461004]|uniref:DUF4886 domain-containing protein n=1 Tax=Thalassobacterium sedimentorum TaxID=3041258 RepID=A0ABU1AIS6_9BACT|nr:DUF4886 domain-containing protein [Coraliomargarita sp. SDUM461004]MDQ8194724.1 DUF4886 domain-containing protein [Coraliomargarita sp. SDUM461004]